MSASDELKKMIADLGPNRAIPLPITSEFIRPLVPPMSQTNPAAWTRKRLIEYIKDFEADLDGEHEVGARLVSFGQAVTFHIADVGYYGPDIISFSGINEEGKKVQLVQHISQLSVLLVAMQKQAAKPRRIGFILDEESNKPDTEA